MAYTVPLTCPACTGQMNITELTCPKCDTRVQGVFQSSGLHRLNSDQLQFVEVFLRCRGNIKEVEKDLKISYPTVRSRLDNVIQTMGYAVPTPANEDSAASATRVLESFEAGDLSFDEALQLLKEERTSNE